MKFPDTERQARCYQMLREPAFEPLIQHWQLNRLEAMQTLSVAKDVDLIRQLQGEIQTLTKILDNVMEAHSLVQKLKGR